MKKAAVMLAFLLLIMSAFTGCRLIRIEETQRTPLEFTVVKNEDIPGEVREFIEEKKNGEFQMTYQVGENLYLIRGYGQQMTGGYSIKVEEVSESENGIFCRTRLIGPSETRQGEKPSYPCIVLKIKYLDKPVQFE